MRVSLGYRKINGVPRTGKVFICSYPMDLSAGAKNSVCLQTLYGVSVRGSQYEQEYKLTFRHRASSI